MSDNRDGKQKPSNLIDVGRISSVFGVKGWVKIHSQTEPPENIFNYNPLWLKTKHGVKAVEVDDQRPHGKILVAHIKGVDSRDQAEALCQVTVAVEKDQLPQLDAGDFYWHQLIGLRVVSEFDGNSVLLGNVTRLLETGANDVLVVLGNSESIDQNERLIPYIPDQFIKTIDIDEGVIKVDWDPEF